jgi:GNAT superfamily N-acetyltransferase
LPVEIAVEQKPGKGERPGLLVRALLDGEQAGVCESVSCGEFTRAEAVQDWMFTTWLGVEEAFRGQGLGKHVLHRALFEMRALGYRHAALSTARDNHRAYLLYTNVGYRMIDWTYGLKKQPDRPS